MDKNSNKNNCRKAWEKEKKKKKEREHMNIGQFDSSLNG